MAEALQRRAQRSRTCQVGKLTLYPEPRLLHELTDELLVTASAETNLVCSPLVAGKGALYLGSRSAYWLIRRARVICCSPSAPSPRESVTLLPRARALKICRALLRPWRRVCTLLLAQGAQLCSSV